LILEKQLPALFLFNFIEFQVRKFRQMKKVKVSTSYNVSIDYVVAGIGERIISNILDTILQGLYVLTFIVLFSILKYSPDAVVYIVLGLPIFLYNLICEVLLQGQTPGMRLRKIKVISLNGKEATASQYLIRWLFRLVDVSLSTGGIAVVSISATRNGQRLGDIAAGTTVVRIGNSITFKDTIFAETEEEYSVQFPEVHLLSDSEIEVIRETLHDYTKTKKRRILEMLSQKVKEKLMISSEMPAQDFLAVILKDYNHYHAGKV
jgi:uncharacterized RDD family membrane protein YckC